MSFEVSRSVAGAPSRLRQHEAFARLPQLADKAIVDLANGLLVTKDHLGEQSKPKGRLIRLLDSLSGEASRRQHAINASLASQMQVTVLYLKDLEVAQSHSLLAIQKVASHVGTVVTEVTQLGDALVELEEDVASIRRDVEMCRQDLQRVDMEQSATRAVTAIFDHWEAGHWMECSPLERTFLAMDALYWGPFGDCVRVAKRAIADQYLKIARDKAAARLRGELEWDVLRPIPLSNWTEVRRRPSLLADSVAYLADTDNSRQPLCQVIASPNLAEAMPRVPKVLSIERAIDRIVEEVFVRRGTA